jgi:hypothetical protein
MRGTCAAAAPVPRLGADFAADVGDNLRTTSFAWGKKFSHELSAVICWNDVAEKNEEGESNAE